MKQKKEKQKDPGICHFTMIELMVVIGIILILAGMLLPALIKSKNTAQAVFCKNNLKQLALSNFMYAAEWEFCAPWGSDAATTNLTRWHGRRDTVSNSADYNPKRGPLWPYLKGKEIIKCPESQKQVDIDADSEEKGGGGYGYNLYVGTNSYFVADPETEESYCSGIRLKDLRNPSSTVMFSDTAMNVNSSGEIESSGQGTLASWSILNAPFGISNKKTDTNIVNDPSIHFLHDRTANVSWSDGHVSPQRLEWTLNSGWKAKNLGSFGSQTDNEIFNPIH
jgi:prepilin-type processing-associated H-X9-DG protein